MASISVIIITKNEEKNIRRCLESVKWADEIIIFDCGSMDKTLEIAHDYTDKIWQTDWPGYGKQKQRALAQAKCDWVFSIDADEVVTPKLRKSINNAIKQTKFTGYYLQRDLMFYGQHIRHGAGTSKILRLAKRSAAKFTADKVHESMLVKGATSKLKGVLLHYSMSSVTEMLNNLNKYTDISAGQKNKAGKTGCVFFAVLKAIWMFLFTYFFKLGCLDGRAGLVLAVGFAEGAFYRYVKLYYLRGAKSK